MTLRIKNKKLLAVAALLLLFAVFLVLFHHHENGQHSHDCAVCRFVQAIACFIVFAVIALAGNAEKSQKFQHVPSQPFLSALLTSSLLGRSPPLLS